MAGFKVDTEKVRAYRQELSDLAGSCATGREKPITTKPGGKTYEALEEMCAKISDANQALIALIDKTILFLGNAGDSFDASDQAEAASVKQSRE